MRRLLLSIFLLVLVLTSSLAIAAPGGASAAKPSHGSRTTTFEACRRGCRYPTIQKAVDAAGAFAWKHRGAKVKVAIRPGRYVEGVVIDGTARHRDFDRMTIEGTKADRRRTILEGRNARGLGAAQDGIEAVDVDGLVLKNMWARNFGSSGFSIHASGERGGHCDGYTMDNLLASGNGSYGFFARGCLGGRMLDSAGYLQGESAFFVGETPCDSKGWNVYAGTQCQANPRWTLLKDDEGYESTLGYSGPNSKYVLIVENAFFDNAAGIVADTLDGEGSKPNGWDVIERNDVFWNNYDAFLAGSAVHPGSGGLGAPAGQTLNYPTGVGIVLYGSDHDVVRGNHVFGNYKWGIASFSGPGEALAPGEGEEAKNVDNEIVENALGRGGADPNGEYDIWNDATGGGNCWGANSANSTFAPGSGKTPPGQIYPVCPQAPVDYATARSTNTVAGLQAGLTEAGDPATILGYAGTNPPGDQQCSWVRRVPSHPAFQRFTPVEVEARPGEVPC